MTHFQPIKQAFQKRKIDKVKLGGFDVDGILRGKYISLDKFFSAVESGFGFCDVIFRWDSSDTLYDNVRLTGWQTGYPDALSKIDLSSFRVLPWEAGKAFFLVDFFKPDGTPLAVSPRQVLRNVVQRAEAMGYSPRASVEFEYFFFREDPQSARDKHFRGLTPFSPGMFGYSVLQASVHSELAHAIWDAARTMEIELEGFHTETGPGVYETAIAHDEAPRAADEAAAPSLPPSLEEATEAFRSSSAAQQYLGKEFVEHFAATRDWEVRQFRKAVTDWELERYFEII